MRIASGVVDQVVHFVAVDATDFVTRETGLSSFTVYRSRNGGTATAMTTPTVTELDATNMPGVYTLLLDEDMTIDAGDETQEMAFHITHAGMAPVTRTIELYRPKITVGNTLGVESDGDLTKVNTLDGHTAQTGDSFARLGAPAGASVSADVAAVKSETAAILDDTDLIDDGTSGLAKIATDVAAILVDTNELQTDDIPGAIAALNNLSAAEVNTEVDTALADIHLDHLLAATYDPASKPGAADALLNELVESDAGVSRFTVNALEQAPSGTGASAASIADAVWEEALADHSGTAGSTAEQLAAAGAAGDPWATALPGAYGAGTAGKIVGDNINATVSSRAPEAGGNVAAIKAVTDALPDAGALTSLASAAALATVDGNVDAILADTGTDGVVVAAASKSGYAISGTLTTLDALDAAQDAQHAQTQADIAGLSIPTVSAIWAGITAAAARVIADHTLRRGFAAAAASSDGDTKSFRSLLGAVAKLVNKVSISGTTLTVTEADDTTSLGTQTLTTDAAAEPITGADTT